MATVQVGIYLMCSSIFSNEVVQHD